VVIDPLLCILHCNLYRILHSYVTVMQIIQVWSFVMSTDKRQTVHTKYRNLHIQNVHCILSTIQALKTRDFYIIICIFSVILHVKVRARENNCCLLK